MRVKEKEKVEQIWGRKDLVGFSTSPVVAARATPVRQAPSQVDFTKSAKKSAEKIRPDPLQMLGTNENLIWSFILTVPPVWILGLVFSAYRSPTVSKNINKKTSIVS